jgi:hypothetical protein
LRVVIGVSGTGSLVAEQLARLGLGRVILIDFDRVERKNHNRIVNSVLADVAAHRLKVESFMRAVDGYRGPGVAVPVARSITTREAVEAAAAGDVLFSCVDTLEARQIADLIASAFLHPLFDVGVVVPVRDDGERHAIGDVCGRIDYVQPGGATLQDRGVYTPATIRAEYLRRVAPEAHRQEVEAGYIRGIVEEAPGVITLNMRAAPASVKNSSPARTPTASILIGTTRARCSASRPARKTTARRMRSRWRPIRCSHAAMPSRCSGCRR